GAVALSILTAHRRCGQPLGLVLADPAGGDVNERGVRAEHRLEVLQVAPVLRQRPLPRLRGEVTLRGLGERQARRLRLRLLIELQEARRQGVLGVLRGPFRLEEPDLFPVLDGDEPPGLSPRGLPGNPAGALARPAGSRSRHAARGRYYQSPWGAIDRPPYPQESNARAVPGSPRRANPRAYRVAPEASVSVARQAGAGAPARASASTPTRSQGRRPRYIPSGRRRNDEQRVGRPSHTPSARVVYLS